MKHYNIYNNTEEGLGQNTDPRGTITDAFYKCNMNHCAIITNEPGAVRGNHYHKYTTQYTLVLTGSMSAPCSSATAESISTLATRP